MLFRSINISSVFSDCQNLDSVYLTGPLNSSFVPHLVWNPSNTVATPIVYYLPAMNPPSISNLLTALWLPRIQDDASFGFREDHFGFNIAWASGSFVRVEACTDLVQSAWSPVAYITITNGLSYFNDSLWTNYPNRFYRLR